MGPAIIFGCLAVYILALVVIGALVAFSGPYECVRRSCTRKANFIIANMNNTVDPCDDFYEFACGNYKNTITYNYKKHGWGAGLEQIRLEIDKQIEQFLKNPLKVTYDRILKIIKKMYQPCCDRNQINLQGVQPLWDAIWMIGGFPVVDGDAWDEEAFSSGDIDVKSRKNGFSGQHFFQSYVALDKKRPNRYSIHIEPPGLFSLPGHELLTEQYNYDLHENYLSFIVRLVFHLLGQEEYEKPEHKEIREKFEKELNRTIKLKLFLGESIGVYKTDQDPVNLYTAMTIDNLQDEFPYVNWKDYFINMLPPSTTLPKDVVVIGKKYFTVIKDIFSKTPARDLSNYFMMQNVLEGMLFLPSNFFSIYNKFKSHIPGSGSSTRDTFCESAVRSTLNGALSALFLQTYNLTEGSQPILQDISERIKNIIRNSIDRIKWMDDKTKESAILKLKNVKLTLSLSDNQLRELQNQEALAEYYEDLCLGSRTSHVLPNYFCIKKFQNKRNWELLSRKAAVFDEDINVFKTNVLWIQKNNEILVPYGVLKYPSFDGEWPAYMNYGGYGSVLGNVFTQGFDSLGSHFNELGFKNYWWTDETNKSFSREIECYKKDFVKYALSVNPSSNIKIGNVREDISSTQGASLAFEAYDSHTKGRMLKEPGFPKLKHYTSKQMFFINFANTQCAYYLKKRLLRDVTAEGTLPYTFRVKESLKNSGEFSKAFNCKPGQKMNPENKCNLLWS